MSSKRRLGPSAPTRLVAEPTTPNDRFETQVYYARAIKQFLMIDRHAKPYLRNWVAVERLTIDTISIERFRGQKHLGVVRILRSFQLHRSALWTSNVLHGLIWCLAVTI